MCFSTEFMFALFCVGTFAHHQNNPLENREPKSRLDASNCFCDDNNTKPDNFMSATNVTVTLTVYVRLEICLVAIKGGEPQMCFTLIL